MFQVVFAQARENITLEASLFSEIISRTMNAMTEMDIITRQATTNRQAEILFKFTVVLLPEDVFVPRKIPGNFEQFKVHVEQWGAMKRK